MLYVTFLHPANDKFAFFLIAPYANCKPHNSPARIDLAAASDGILFLQRLTADFAPYIVASKFARFSTSVTL